MLFRFEVSFADVDGGNYRDHDLRVAQHPSEDAPRLLTRVLAYVMEYREGMTFGKGLSDGDDAAVYVQTPDGRITDWIDVGSPAPDRLHRAAKLAERVAVYAHRRPDILVQKCQKERIHNKQALRIVAVPADALAFLEQRLERNNKWDVSITEGRVMIVCGPDVCETAFELLPL